jgi:NAD(P)-dependent dehydrogenase (short-subunit alcohol dehydrogenase family)
MNAPNDLRRPATLEGMRVLITGGARGLGAATGHALARAGAIVVVGDLNAEGARKTAAELGTRASFVALDVGDAAQVAAAIGEVHARLGGLDAVINNAAIDFTLSLDELSVEQWDAVTRVNLRGPFLVSKHAAALMARQGRGHIVNIASTASKRTWANAAAYHATKWGLLGLSHALHAELRPRGIKVTAVVAGGMRTPFLLDRFPDIDHGLLQDPANVAETICFVLGMPGESVVPEIMVLPMRESSWP